MTIERLTGKQQVLPELSQRWPALDRTKSPNARAPRADSQPNEAAASHEVTSPE